jgi:hypothetical protein
MYFRLLLAAASFLILYLLLRPAQEPQRPRPEPRALPGPDRGIAPEDEVEPVLGFDGMDIQTAVPWLESAGLDRQTLLRIRRYEQRNQAREAVLRAIDDLL